MQRTPQRVFEEYLVTLAQGGDRRALEHLAKRWRGRHFAHARRLLGRADLAADAVQDAWESVLRGLWRLGDPARFPAWSYSIVTRRCRDLQRRGARRAEVAVEVEPVDEAAADGEAGALLRRALSKLNPEQRAALALYYRDGFSVGEIAEVLGIPAGTVKTRLFHARRLLRAELEGEDNEQD